MHSLHWSSLALLLLSSALPAQQPSVAERLGYPADAKLLILHGDDLGVAHSVNVASLDALSRGDITSASIMMPTPWVSEVAAYARAHPNADLGLHLTLTAEWETYKWGSVASKDRVQSLLDSAGYFPNDVPPVVARANPAEVEVELQAQIDRAHAMGIHPSHVDSHMGTLFASNALIGAYVKVAHANHVPFLAVGGSDPRGVRFPLAPNDIALNDVIVAGPEVPRDRWKEFYLNAIANLKPGVTEIIVHLGHDDAELRAVTVNHEPYGAAWRQRDYDVVTSPEFKKALAEHHVILVGWRDLQKLSAQP